jgi:hypothetical protein
MTQDIPEREKKGTKKKGTDSEVQGEGNYDAARRYNKAAREHARKADVEGEARDAEPRDAGEASELERAENEGRSHAKDEDPLLDEPERIERQPESSGRK